MSLKKFSWRSMWRRPGRTVLTLLSIVIGVAAVVSVTITTATTRNAYKQMATIVSGRADLVVEGEGEVRFPGSLLADVQAVPGVKVAVPVFATLSALHTDDKVSVRVQLLGVDVEHDTAVREYAVTEGRRLEGGRELLLDETYARRLKVQVGDEVRLTVASLKPKPVTVVGFLKLRGASALQHAGLVLMPIETAQTLYKVRAQLSSIQIITEPDVSPDTLLARIEPILPTGIRVHPPAVRTHGMQEMLYSSEKGLQMTTSCTLLLAAFIILNTFMMNISERRRQLSILRAVGATADQIMLSVMREAMLLGIVGTAIGIGLGLLAALGLNRSLSRLLEVPLPAMELSWLPFALAIVFGLGMSAIGAFMPARNARKISPLEGMDRVSRADLGNVPPMYIEFGGIITLGSATLIVLSIRGFLPMDVAIVAGAFLFVGLVLMLPLMLSGLCRAFVFLIRPLARVESSLALRQVLRHYARSTLTVGVLFVAGAGGVGMAYSILDNVRDVQVWYRKTIVGDFFIRAMMPEMGTLRSASLSEEVAAALRKVPRIESVEGISWVTEVSVANASETSVMVVARDLPGEPSFDLIQGDVRRVRQQMVEGGAVIGSVLSQRLSLSIGDTLELETKSGKVPFPICAVTNDYLSGGLSVHMYRPVAVKMLGVEGYTVLAVRAHREDLAVLEQELQSLCDEYGVLLHSNAEIISVIDGLVTGIDGCLWGLVVLVFVVASFGVVNTLTMNVLEQTRELGVLRIVAMTRRQVRRTILLQALIMGMVGFGPGMLGGVGFAWVINLAIPAALGHPVEFGYHPWLLSLTLASALTVTLLAAWIPAQRAANLDIGAALHYE